MRDQPNQAKISRQDATRIIILGFGLIVGAGLMVIGVLVNQKPSLMRLSNNTYFTPYAAGAPGTATSIYPSRECTFNCEGWGQPVPSPNGKYIYKEWRTHYGERSFVVMTADYSQIIYDVDTVRGAMYLSGCGPEGWQPDGTLLFSCARADPSEKWLLNPDARTIEAVSVK